MKANSSFFLLKNSVGSKMRKFCSGDGSTSIRNQRKANCAIDSSCMATKPFTSSEGTLPPTLEEMILQLEIEEKMARNARKQEEEEDEYGEVRRRMSCVNSSDILRTARNALNQYPRFSLDGKDAMYRSSFRNLPPISSSSGGIRKGFNGFGLDSGLERTLYLPSMVGGESVVWCQPGVVAKLMGLEAVPVPVRSNNCRKESLISSSVLKRQNLRKRVEKHEMERRRKLVMDVDGGGQTNRGRGMMGSCSTTGYCVRKPIKTEPPNDGGGWPMRRFR